MGEREEGHIACEWDEKANGTVTTSCGARIREPDRHSVCPKCKGTIVFFDHDFGDDDEPYFDDE